MLFFMSFRLTNKPQVQTNFKTSHTIFHPLMYSDDTPLTLRSVISLWISLTNTHSSKCGTHISPAA